MPQASAEFAFERQQLRLSIHDFNALFVGPGKLLAAPFASVYLEDDALVMGKATLEIRDFMAA
ncbi:molecular chaperone TorD family protein, partial [Salmonella enterica subsp. enterica serovar Montevideo]|nr:molecular chaperone TorD family protein [Salmonella enterica subsp. enterica serovar Montevideo]